MKTCIVAGALMLALAARHAAAAEDFISARSSLLLNGVWEFAEAPDGEPPVDGWQPVRVPHRSREFEEEPPASAWYRTTFTVPDGWSTGESDIVIEFGRVRHYSRIYIDGEVAGEHYGNRTPFEIDLTEIAEPGKPHTLLIYTHNCSGDYAHQTAKDLSEDAMRALDTLYWFNGAATVGIEGDVWLRLVPLFRIDDVYVITSLRERKITVEVTVSNHHAVAIEARLSSCVENQLKPPVQPIKVDAGETKVVRLEAAWENPALWGHPPYGEPKLYFLETELTAPNRVDVYDTNVVRFGFREVWADGDRLLLNGVPLFPWGDHTIPYVHERQWLTRKLPELAAANVSIIENHRFNPPPVVYDVADELGMFVNSANFCVGTGQVPGNLSPEEHAIVLANHLEIIEHWIRRNRNHPSILFWDVTDAWQPKWCVPMLQKVREFDSSRIVEVTYRDSPPEILELVDTYRLFSSLQQIEKAIARIRESGELPVKPIRVGEAGIFTKPYWGYDEQPPLAEGWLEFLLSMSERNIHGLQTFYLCDMDYLGFNKRVPGMLFEPVIPKVNWPSQSGTDARIDPFGESTQQAWGKAGLYLNWCDPDKPLSHRTQTHTWWAEMHRKMVGRDAGPIADTRVPEVIVTVLKAGKPVPAAQVFVQSQPGAPPLVPYGITADENGRAWFVLPDEGTFRFYAAGVEQRDIQAFADVDCKRSPIDLPPGYNHIQHVTIELDEE